MPQEHRRITAALRARDADGAATAMMKHLQDVTRSILGS
jgi:DNA-binding GntR family transcriptional regulator